MKNMLLYIVFAGTLHVSAASAMDTENSAEKPVLHYKFGIRYRVYEDPSRTTEATEVIYVTNSPKVEELEKKVYETIVRNEASKGNDSISSYEIDRIVARGKVMDQSVFDIYSLTQLAPILKKKQ